MEDKEIEVLLVEDNPGDAFLIANMLASARGVTLNMECIDRLSEAVNRIDVGSFHVVLLDLSLPDSHGLETFTEMHEKAPGTPIIVLSGLDDEELAVKAVQEGAQDYLVKGQVDSNLLVRSIRYAIERKQTEEQLIQSEKLAGIGMLASGIAHEINNPLAGILGYSEIILNDEIPAQTKEYAKKLIKEAERAANIVKWLSRYSKQAKDSNITNVDLKDVICESLEALKHTRKSYEIEIIKNYKEIPKIKGNKSELQQVFINLMNNAVDAMPEGGVLNLSTACNSGSVEAQISDNGMGIPKEKLTRIFEPFFTMKEVGEGTGLGLYVTSMIVKKHHGTIDVRSDVGKGTNFTLRFPISEVNP